MARHLYVSNSGSEFLSHFIMDEDSGKLAPQPDIDLGGAPGAVATNSGETVMYVCLRPSGDVVSFRIDKGSGALARMGAAALVEGPPYLYLDNSGRFLLAAYYGAAGVTSHRIEADGTVGEQLQWLDTETHAHSIQTDRSNRFAFVPHTNPANSIHQFRFDESSGELAPNDPPVAGPESEEGPRHFVFHPQRDFFYSVNENGNTVSAFHFDPDRGTLEPFQLIPTVPEGTDLEGKTTAEIRISADGRHLYASNRGHDSLALFEVGGDGRLTAKGHFETEATPRFFDIAPGGRFLYSAGQDSDRLVSYRIDPSDGSLETLERHDVGGGPLWIQFVAQE